MKCDKSILIYIFFNTDHTHTLHILTLEQNYLNSKLPPVEKNAIHQIQKRNGKKRTIGWHWNLGTRPKNKLLYFFNSSVGEILEDQFNTTPQKENQFCKALVMRQAKTVNNIFGLTSTISSDRAYVRAPIFRLIEMAYWAFDSLSWK